MPVYELIEDPVFPPVDEAEEGLIAVGGDLRPARLIAAYASGVFPWPHEGYPMLWFSPDPRMVLEPGSLHVGRSLRKAVKSGRFEIRLDTAFSEVVRGCATAGRGQGVGTWITSQMAAAYQELHRLGFAHSAEAWHEGRLVGGLYGVSIGSMFTGESMFALEANASKTAFVWLVRQLERWDFDFVDCQTESLHLARLGARPWPRARFIAALESARARPTRRGVWRFDEALDPAA